MVVDSVAIDNNQGEFRRSLGYLGGAAAVCAVFTALRGMLFSFAIARLKVRCVDVMWASLRMLGDRDWGFLA